MEQNELTVIIYYKKTLNSCYVDFTENEYIINALKVLDGFKKQGIGTYLIKSAEDIIKKLGGDCAYLFVLGKNEWVHNWYKRLGYTDTDVECEDGDIVIRGNNSLGGFILPYRGTDNDGGVLTEMYCDRADLKINTFSNAESGCGFTREYCLATEDEKQIFFDALAKIGKQWNAENKCIEDIKSKFYFKPKDWCLMSCGGYNEWVLCQFSNIKDLGYIAVGGKYFTQCIPYNDETKHLIGTTDDAPEKYKTW